MKLTQQARKEIGERADELERARAKFDAIAGKIKDASNMQQLLTASASMASDAARQCEAKLVAKMSSFGLESVLIERREESVFYKRSAGNIIRHVVSTTIFGGAK